MRGIHLQKQAETFLHLISPTISMITYVTYVNLRTDLKL